MSTIVVVRKANKIAIGADTLVKLNDYIKKSSDYLIGDSKIEKIGDNYLAYTGPSAWGSVFKAYFSEPEKVDFASKESIFREFTALHRKAKEEYYLLPTEDEDDEFESLQMSCFIANSKGIFGVDNFRWVQEFSKFWANGTGYEFALGAMRAVYENTDNVEEIAQIGLQVAAEFDDSTGGPFEIYTLELC